MSIWGRRVVVDCQILFTIILLWISDVAIFEFHLYLKNSIGKRTQLGTGRKIENHQSVYTTVQLQVQ